MGNGATRTLERVAAAMGELESAPIEFQATCDVAQGGVLLALPALLAAGLLSCTARLYQLPKGFYGIESLFLLLGLMALARIRSLEQLRYQAPGEWGKLLGLDRIPEVDPARETETVVPGLGASRSLERGTGQGMDSPAKRHRTVFLLRWPCARVSRRPDRFAAPLCGPRAVVSASHDRLLDQRNGRPALPVREQGSGSRADRHAQTGCDSVVRGECGQDAGAATAAGGRSTRPLVHHRVRPGRLQSRVVREDAGEADCHADLSQISQTGLAQCRVRHAQCPAGRGRNGDHETGRARYTLVQQSVVAGDPQTQ